MYGDHVYWRALAKQHTSLCIGKKSKICCMSGGKRVQLVGFYYPGHTVVMFDVTWNNTYSPFVLVLLQRLMRNYSSELRLRLLAMRLTAK